MSTKQSPEPPMVYGADFKRLVERARLSEYRGIVSDPTHTGQAMRPSCGDTVSFTAEVRNGVILKICFMGTGCILSQAAADLVAQHAEGKSLEDMAQVADELILSRIGLELGINRRLCVTSAVEALRRLCSGSSVPYVVE